MLGLTTSRWRSRPPSKRSSRVSTRPSSCCRSAEAAQAVLHDDHRAVDDEPEVQRAQAHQIGGDTVLHHAGDRQQHRERNHRRGDQRRADVAQQQEQHRDHQQRALEQILVSRCAMLRSTSVVRSYTERALTPSRQRCLDLAQLLARALRHVAAVLADQHEHRAEHDLVAILASRRRCAVPSPSATVRHIARCAAALPSRMATTTICRRPARRRPARERGSASARHCARCSPRPRWRCCARSPGSDRPKVRSKATSFAGSGVTWICWTLPPMVLTSVTPLQLAQLRSDHPVLQRAQIRGCPRRAVSLGRARARPPRCT